MSRMQHDACPFCFWRFVPQPSNVEEKRSRRTGLKTGDVVKRIMQSAVDDFEIHERWLYRKVWDPPSCQYELRPVVPWGGPGCAEVPTKGFVRMMLRQALIFQYHDSPLGGHMGRDMTFKRLEKDFWWPGMHDDCQMHIKAKKWERILY